MTYFIAATDYGKEGNIRYPRWRVYRYNRRRTAGGHIGNTPVSDYFWTQEEASAEYRRLSEEEVVIPNWVLVALAVIFVIAAFWWTLV